MSAINPARAIPRAQASHPARISVSGPKFSLALGTAMLGAFVPLSIATSSSYEPAPPRASLSQRLEASLPGSRLTAADIATRDMSPFNLMELSAAMAVTINARRHFDGRLETVSPLRYMGSLSSRANAIDCLAAAAYYEAGDDPGGQRAVVQVVLNRARHPAYPKSVCDVVFQGSQRRTGCQFTFTCDGSLRRKPSATAWTRARRVAQAALDGAVDARVGTATHYHADYVLPYWAGSLQKINQIGAHIFYRWPGTWGGRKILAREVAGTERPLAMLTSPVRPQQGDVLAQPAAPSVPAIDEADADPALVVPSAIAAVGSTPAPPLSSTIMTVADRGSGAGRWAVNAMNRCAGRASCVVLAYRDADEVARNRAAEPLQREAPLFLFIRDAASGMTITLWDCEEAPRPGSGQCMPAPGPALAKLLRDRD